MRRIAIPGLVALIAVALVALLVFGVLQTSDDSSLDQAVARGERPLAHDAPLPRLDGDGTVSLADHRDGYVVLNFFASWCEPCEAEAPLLNRVQRRLDARGDGTVLGVAWEDATSAATAFVRRHEVTFPVARDVDGGFGEPYELRALPESFVIDPEGRIVAIARGQITERWVRETLEPLIAGKLSVG
jgi:cytochrome c biogenesis protein CcmG/thiol:disulfide interchange protein DsbE